MESLGFILDEIKKEISGKDVFRYKTSDLLYILSDTVDKMIIDSTFKATSSPEDSLNENTKVSNAGYGYRQLLKFIYEFSTENGLERDYEIIKNGFEKLIPEMYLFYNEIRNRIDRHKLGNVKLEYNENTKTITENGRMSNRRQFIRASELNNLRNNSIEDKLDYMKYLTKSRNAVENFKYMHYFRDYIEKEHFDKLINIAMMDSEISYDADFGDFRYFDVIKVCAALYYIAIFKLASNFGHYHIRKLTSHFYCEKCDIFIKHVSDISKVNIKTVTQIVNYMIYDPVYQSSKLTLLQHLIRINDNIIFSPNVLIPAELPKKFYRLINDFDKAKYEKVFSLIAKNKENDMINEIVENYKTNKDIVIKTNIIYKLPKSKVPNAEYDMIIYDKKTKTMILCECKWFYVADGEYENSKVNKKIKESILHRLTKDNIAKENLYDFKRKVFTDDLEIEKVESLIISYTHMGDEEIQFEIPVIDFVTFKNLSLKYDYDIIAVYMSIKQESFIEDLNIVQTVSEFDYCGYHFKLNRTIIGLSGQFVK